MQDFFKSKKFIVIVLLVALSLFFMLRAAYSGTGGTLAENVVAFVTEPFQKAGSKIFTGVNETFHDFIHAPSIAEENEKLKAENAALTRKMAKYNEMERENKRMKEFFGMKEENPSYEMVLSDVIGRDASDRFYSFTIDKGSKDGIVKYSSCLTKEGLVGIVTSVGKTYSKVSTILDPTSEVGVEILETGEIGITEGSTPLAVEGNLKLSYLPRDCKAKVGDTLITTGLGGIFPRGIVVGKIKEIAPDSQGLTLNAVIEPVIDIRKVSDVIVITDFEGKEAKVE